MEDVHIIIGQVPVGRLDNSNVYREIEVSFQLLIDQLCSSRIQAEKCVSAFLEFMSSAGSLIHI